MVGPRRHHAGTQLPPTTSVLLSYQVWFSTSAPPCWDPSSSGVVPMRVAFGRGDMLPR